MAATLRDPEMDEALRREGFVVLDLLPAEKVRSLLELCLATHEPRSGWESDFYSPDPAIKRAVHEGIRAALAPPVEEHFVAHRSLLHNFVVNWPGADGGLVLHQHSSLIDERIGRSVIVWCAVTDADEANGTLHVVPRSHLVQQGPKPERSPSWMEEHKEVILRDHLVAVPLRAGQALVFDNQLLHCSFANRTDRPRITAAAAVIPVEAEPRFYEWLSDDRVSVHHLDPEFFFEHVAGDLEWASPDDLEVIEELDWVPTVVSEAELPTLLPKGSCCHGTD